MKTRIVRPALLMAACLFGSALSRLSAQAVAGRADPDKPVVSISYYKVPPGRQDDWLALYKKYHYPIMKYQIAHGYAISEKIYTRTQHAVSPSWDFLIVITTPAPGKGPKPTQTRRELIRSLFPDVEDYVKGEKARWALTLEHWDDGLLELDPEKNFSVYDPN
jgi:hypothetical protein